MVFGFAHLVQFTVFPVENDAGNLGTRPSDLGGGGTVECGASFLPCFADKHCRRVTPHRMNEL